MNGDLVKEQVMRPRNPGESLTIAHSTLKRRDRNIDAHAKKLQKIREEKTRRYKLKGKTRTISLEQILRTRMRTNRDQKRVRRIEKRSQAPVNPEIGSVFLALRNEIFGMSTGTWKLLKDLRLETPHTGVFVPNTQEYLDKLTLLGPYISYGVPSEANISHLLSKRGRFIKEDGEVPLSGNQLIETHLGDQGYLCIEDLVHCVTQGLPEMMGLMSHFVPFQLNDIRTTDRPKHSKRAEWEKYYKDEQSFNEDLRKVLG